MAAAKLLGALFAAPGRPSALLACARSAAASVSAALSPRDGRPPSPPELELCGVSPGPAWGLPRTSAEDSASEGEEGGGAGSWWKRVSDLEALKQSIWFAVPKRKSSYSRKRKRQLNPLYAAQDIQHFYPCPKCTKGLLKLRHHICPCDQEAMNYVGVKKVSYASLRRAEAAAPATPGAGEPSPSRAS